MKGRGERMRQNSFFIPVSGSARLAGVHDLRLLGGLFGSNNKILILFIE